MTIYKEIFAKLDQVWRAVQGVRCDINDLELRMTVIERRVSFSLPVENWDEDWDHEEAENKQQHE